MAQQKSENRVVPDDGGMPVQPSGDAGGHGKAVPVEQTAGQLQLPVATAEDPAGSAREVVRDRSRAGRAGVPKATVTEQPEMRRLDAHIRRRLRAIVLHHWKRQRTIARRLIAL